MAKKKSTRRPNISAETLARARAELRSEPSMAEPTATSSGPNGVAAPAAAKAKPLPRAGSGLATRRVPSPEELKQQYAYVMKDMRNLAVLAALLFAFIIVAAALMPLLVG